VTPRHGVRMQARSTQDLAGDAGTAPRWLRLTRTGSSVTGYSSADGVSWQQIGTFALAGLPRTAEVGLFVNSPPTEEVIRTSGGSSETVAHPTVGRATFDQVSLRPATPARAGRWQHLDVGAQGDAKVVGPKVVGPQPAGTVTQHGGTFVVTGSGDMV